MPSIHSPSLSDDLKDGTLFIDTNVFVGAFAQQGAFESLFLSLRSQNCVFLTIPSVLFEFLRGSSTLEFYSEKAKFMESLVTLYNIEHSLADSTNFNIVMQKVGGKVSYTDFLLCACLEKFHSAYLLTEDRDIPLSLFDRTHIFVVDSGQDIRCYGFYKFSEDKFNKVALTILNES